MSKEETISIWSRCDISQVDGVVYVGSHIRSITFDEQPDVWRLSTVTRDIPTVSAILALRGQQVKWDKVNGFAMSEYANPIGWEVLLRGEEPMFWAQWYRGVDTNRLYAFVTNSMERYTADYGGAKTWHVLKGAWLVNAPIIDGAAKRPPP